MNKADVEFTVGLNTSPAEEQLDRLFEKMRYPGNANHTDPFLQFHENENLPYVYGGRNSVPPSANINTTFNNSSNLPIARKAMELADAIRIVYSRMNEALSGYRYAGSSVWNEQKRIGFDNLPTTSAGNKIQEAVSYVFEQKALPGWKYAGSSTADSIYDEFEDLHVYDDYGNSNVPPKNPTFTNPSADGNDTPEEQGKDIVSQNKKDNDELKEKLLLWGKILSTIYAIRKVLQGLSKLWKFATDTVSGVNSNINEEHGFFSTDPEGALRANTDKTRAMLYAGVRNMGENAPVSKAGLDYASNKITEMWTSAMSGRNVDARTTIDVQRLKDFFGIDLSVAGLLTGEREGKTATDIQIDMMDKVEKQISKLAEADEITKGQVIDSLKNILGDELVNAIVANANKNLKIDATDLKLTLAERIMQNGGTAIASGDLTQSTEKSIKALSALNTEIGKLKNTLVQELSPAFVTVTETLADIVDWLNRKMNKVDGEKNAIGEVKAKVSIASLTNDEYSRYRNFKQEEDDKKNKYKDKDNTVRNLLKSGDPLKILEALYLSQPEVKSAADIENLGIKQQEIEVGNAFKNAYKTGKFDPNSTNPLIKALAEHPYTNPDDGRTYYGYEAFTQELATNPNIGWDDPFISRLLTNPENMDEYEMLIAMRNMASLNPAVRNAFSKEFDKGGTFDFGTTMAMIPYLYSTRMLGSPEEQFKAFQVLAQESYKVLDNVVNLDVKHNDKNGNGKIDAGEIELTVILKDQYGKTLTTQSINADLN
jgi:hypothetical protein